MSSLLELRGGCRPLQIDLEDATDSETMRQDWESIGLDLKNVIRDYVMKGLNREERLMLMLYYCEGLSFDEIGLVLNVDVSRVKQIHLSVISRMASALREDGLERVA